MDDKKLTAKEKATLINQNPSIYGTFAEIGAGQEVARAFFLVGGASATIAKSISAYDMVFSDSIYGAEESKRYVCESRLLKMLDHEYGLLMERLSEKRPGDTTFFAFADTVAAKSMRGNKDWHGWLGIRFQTKPHGAPNDIILHVRMLDHRNFLQQEAIGVLGVNLTHGAFYLRNNPEKLLSSLMDGLDQRRMVIDGIRFDGPDLKHIDNRWAGLRLVQLGYTNAVVFLPNGSMSLPSEILYDRHVLVQRGTFRPPTLLNMDMHDCGLQQFCTDHKISKDEVSVLLEIHMDTALKDQNTSTSDFLARIDLLSSLNQMVLVSNYPEYFQLISQIKKCTKKNIGMVLGVGHLPEIFSEKHFSDYEGGLLETVGRVFNGDQVKLYIYPSHTLSVSTPAARKSGQNSLFTARSPGIFKTLEGKHSKEIQFLFQFCINGGLVADLVGYHHQFMKIDSREVLKMIQNNDPNWEALVPKDVSKVIKDQGFFGFSDTNKRARRAT